MISFNPGEKRRVALYQEVFTSGAGQKVLADLMERNFIFTSTQDSDPHETAFREGRRAVILAILVRLKISPDQLRSMESHGREYSEYDDGGSDNAHGI